MLNKLSNLSRSNMDGSQIHNYPKNSYNKNMFVYAIVVNQLLLRAFTVARGDAKV